MPSGHVGRATKGHFSVSNGGLEGEKIDHTRQLLLWRELVFHCGGEKKYTSKVDAIAAKETAIASNSCECGHMAAAEFDKRELN